MFESETATSLDECLRDDLFMLATQPIFEAGTLRRVAFEVLLRSRHARLTTPHDLFVAAEASGRVGELTGAVLRRAAALCANVGGEPHIFINLHPLDLGDAALLERNVAPLVGYAPRVVFEITERMRLDSVAGWRESLAVLRQLGFAVALDDLGEGYSSLKMLSELRPRYVKLDRSLVSDVHADRWRERLIASLASFCRELDVCLIGEGVEAQPDADALSRLGVDWLQGYLFARPTIV